uniref:LysM and putative peptidoglycan-binding domain-containing protein 1 n=1 Tax=Laticauda laticaudata TaxID=8630 RepID=A0A8C5RFJ4_LATLA
MKLSFDGRKAPPLGWMSPELKRKEDYSPHPPLPCRLSPAPADRGEPAGWGAGEEPGPQGPAAFAAQQLPRGRGLRFNRPPERPRGSPWGRPPALRRPWPGPPAEMPRRAAGSGAAASLPPRSRPGGMASPPSGRGSPGAAGLLRGSRARSYGSLVSSPVRERRLEHQLRPGDTLQGLAVMYGVTTEQIQRANRLYTNDSIFLKKTLLIPVPTKPKALSNGLDFEEGEEKGGEPLLPESTKKQKQPRKNGSSGGSVPKHDLSAADFLFKLDSEIRRSKQAAAKKLREGESAILGEAAGMRPTHSSSGSYQGEPSPRAQQRAVLGPVPLTRIARADALLDQEDEIFKL